ncbi:hypothetical protein [Microbacterium sp.]|uniref:hypothetical protein n=1 Tax=Microbacterium sp. TaxID=51671 RepID=UPI003F726767
MNVRDLLTALEDLNPEAEVRFAHQPHYPIWGVVGGVAVPPPAEATDREVAAWEKGDTHFDGASVVYLTDSEWAAGGYAPEGLWNEWAVAP